MNDPKDFAEALVKKVPRPFTFGPIEFGDLNNSGFRIELAKDMIINCLESNSIVGES